MLLLTRTGQKTAVSKRQKNPAQNPSGHQKMTQGRFIHNTPTKYAGTATTPTPQHPKTKTKQNPETTTQTFFLRKRQLLKKHSIRLKTNQSHLTDKNFCAKSPKFSFYLKNAKKARRIAEKTGSCFAWRFSRVLIWGPDILHANLASLVTKRANWGDFTVLGIF